MGVSRENPHGENMQTRTERACLDLNPGPSCCGATALTAAPLCRRLQLAAILS